MPDLLLGFHSQKPLFEVSMTRLQRIFNINFYLGDIKKTASQGEAVLILVWY